MPVKMVYGRNSDSTVLAIHPRDTDINLYVDLFAIRFCAVHSVMDIRDSGRDFYLEIVFHNRMAQIRGLRIRRLLMLMQIHIFLKMVRGMEYSFTSQITPSNTILYNFKLE